MEVLDLHNNMIGSLPDDVLHCKALRTLDLSNNNLHSLPENLGDLENLTELVLSDNQITCLPSSIGKQLQADHCTHPCIEDAMLIIKWRIFQEN